MKKIFFSVFISSLIFLNQVKALDLQSEEIGSSVNNTVKYTFFALYFLAISGVVFGGFLIYKSGGYDLQVKNGKIIIIVSLTALFVIWLASSMINFFTASVIGY
ncbi:MAG: hypothetical protein PHN31_05315 [Candidatus Gracilibacteria bacterium]|nr:hypothetical protein [Candidatus Gracilibacteria bacterium]